MSNLLLLADTPLGVRIGVGAVAIVVGLVFIAQGLANIQSRSAEESGSRRWVNWSLGRSNSYEGSAAVVMGVVRVIADIGAIIFGLFFMVFGAILA